ncbi:MAG: OB-fold domain-containing protein [Myxococcota bacterium]|jgi:hypothetical protein|nr:DNA-binding protein [Deltaproteobacteria bacterium]MCP4240080.1 DNA-binding protein [bacterium]MDP6076100.1 OB-fold domain-containing protein [Myxococcota bacterium]MDP6243954.1 OB-fold domain-containing protein [Myxococcota bacterium]MDP7073552.1 OB-fold domain-containing protein [Myxococcota bacterium]
MAEKPFRLLPRVTDRNRHFWQGGKEGRLQFLRCRACATWVHPPQPVCPECLGKDLVPEPVSGRAQVLTFTLNHQPWVPAPDHPYCIAIVEIEEQEGLRLMTNVVHCAPEEVAIGMPVRVVFEEQEDVWFPLFEPDEDRA